MSHDAVPVHLLIPFEWGSQANEIMNHLSQLQEVGISFEDVICESIALAAVCLNPLVSEDDLIPNIDTSLVEHVAEAHTKNHPDGYLDPGSQQYHDFVSALWFHYTGATIEIFGILFPHVRAYLNKSYPHYNEPGHEYRCSDVAVNEIRIFNDSILARFVLYFTGQFTNAAYEPASYI